jgi:hypothetical protein
VDILGRHVGIDGTRPLRFAVGSVAIELHALGLATHSPIYFFADPMIDRNVLGRTGWLDRVRLGLIHHDNKIYLASYDAA